MKIQTLIGTLAISASMLISLNAVAGPGSEQWRRMKDARHAGNENIVELTVNCKSGRSAARTSRRGHARMYHVNPYRWNYTSNSCMEDTGIEIANDERRSGNLN